MFFQRGKRLNATPPSKRTKQTFGPLAPLRRLGRPALVARLEASSRGSEDVRRVAADAVAVLQLVARDWSALARGGRGTAAGCRRSFRGREGGGAGCRRRCRRRSSRHRLWLLCFSCFDSRASSRAGVSKKKWETRRGIRGGKQGGRRRRERQQQGYLNLPLRKLFSPKKKRRHWRVFRFLSSNL